VPGQDHETKAPSFTCPCCGKPTSHPDDIADRYCGQCHWWTGDLELGPGHLSAPCPHRPAAGTPPPPDMRILLLRAFPVAILGAVAFACFSVWLALSHRIRGADIAIVSSELPLAGAALGATVYMWWSTRRFWARMWHRND
jgi:hypothetical protein